MAKSTKIIAALGVAGALGIAALPMASYAADKTEIVDTINITVDPSCAFQAKGTADAVDGTYNKTIANGGEEVFEAHYFNVFCNDPDGYKVTAVAEGLENDTANAGGTKDTIAYVASTDYETAKAGANKATGAWTAILDGGNTGAAISTTSSTIKSSTAAVSTDGETFNVVYKVYVGTQNDAGTYSGTVTYNVTAN